LPETQHANPGLGNRIRPLQGPVRYIHEACLISLAVLGAVWSLEIHSDLGIIIFKEQFLALIFSIGMFGVFLSIPARPADFGPNVPWYDWLFAAGSLFSGLFIVFYYPVLRDDMGLMSIERASLGIMTILLVMEATRRIAGWALVILALALMFYAKFADYFPGFLEAPPEKWDRLSIYMYLDGNALFGFPLSVTASMIIAFIIFGRMLYAVNGDKVLTDFAMATMGKYRGGPAKVAVLASSFFGTISGSAVANVLMDGPITIPMMRKSGFPGHLAAATEAVASTGGQIMPPVMGITAFIMAEFLAVPYGDVVLAAMIPALLYYVALFTQIDLESAKYNLAGIARDQLPRMRSVAARGWVFVIPIVVLIWTLMVERWQPGKSAMTAAICAVIVGSLQPATRPTFKKLIQEIRETGRILLDLVVITSIAGIIIGLLQLTGLAFNISLLLTEAAGGSLPILLLLTAIVCIVLGMGMPSAVIYIVLSVIAAPALVKAGVVEMSAHLFLFYFGMLSMITPPVCLATIAAASVANTNFWQTGWAGVRLGFIAYVVPFLIVYRPELIFQGSLDAIAIASLQAVIGVIVLCYAVAGYMHHELGWLERIVLAVAGLAILTASLTTGFGMATAAIAIAVVGGLSWKGRRQAANVPA
jgi:TRAP transporter 4TM/12TM fusion protein